MSNKRVHLVLAAEEHARYRVAASGEGVSLSEWLRTAAERHLEASEPATLATVDELDEFFSACDEAEEGSEPDWDEHLAVIAESRRPS